MIRSLADILIRSVSFMSSRGLAATAAGATLLCASGAAAAPSHAIAMHGEPKYGPGFKCFAYASPQAAKGGRIAIANPGASGSSQSFDSLNPFIVKGNPAAGLSDPDRSYVFEPLMVRAADEPFSLYGLLAETIETPEDRSWVRFELRPEARFSDGAPVTPEDVLFSHTLLRDHGRPTHRAYYAKVAKAEKTGERGVTFTFTGADREMPLIMGLMPVLPRQQRQPDSFEETTLTPPIGSGPYRVTRVEPGASLTFTRNPDYWGKRLAVNCGFHNFDEVRHDYYRDVNSAFEGFKKGLYDFRIETSPSRWAREYDFPALRDGRAVKESFPLGVPAGMSALAFNTRRPLFGDRRVRQALTLLFNFEWINRNLFHGLYVRTESYFARSELSSHGRPADARERALLAPFPDAVSPGIMDGAVSQPAGDAAGSNRDNRLRALALLEEAGYGLEDGKLIEKKSGQPFAFEILAASREQERLMLTYARALESVGVEARLRQVDVAQYERRKKSYDFDMIHNFWPASLSPGNEQGYRWASWSATREGSFNFAGVQNKAVDAMIAAMLAAKSRDDFVSAVRALDRVLLSGNYVLPLFHLNDQWVASSRRLGRPATGGLQGSLIDTWWIAGGASVAHKSGAEADR